VHVCKHSGLCMEAAHKSLLELSMAICGQETVCDLYNHLCLQAPDEMVQCVVCEDWFHFRVSVEKFHNKMKRVEMCAQDQSGKGWLVRNTQVFYVST